MNPVGFIDEVTRHYITGWAADRDDLATSLRFGVFVDGSGCAELEANQLRPGLERELGPDATGRYAFNLYFPVPLSPYRDHVVTLRCTTGDFSLETKLPGLRQRGIPPDDDLFRPQAAVLVTSGGRSGSTAIMELLRSHPRIVVAGGPPYEVEMGCYYAHALRTLTASANHQRSLRPDRITDVQEFYRVGFNPYFEPFSFDSVPALRQFLSGSVAGRIGEAFREIILDYYQGVAREQGKLYPAVFAEKTLPEPDSRLGIRYLFGNTKEIVLLRDPRDVICSFMKHGRVSFEEALSNAVTTARRCIQIKEEADENVQFLRYEDFVLQPQAKAEELFSFVGLFSAGYHEAHMGQLFNKHGTSRTPQDSIGRWRRDLTTHEAAECRQFERFLEAFGYPA